MKHSYALGLLLALSVVPALPNVRAAEPPSAIISEIAWAGSEKSTADEWIEIRNIGSQALDVSGWSLTGVGTSGSAITIPSASSIAAGSAYLVANYSMTDPKTALIVKPDLVTTTVSIPNSSLNVALVDATGTVVDSLVDPGAPNFGSSTTFSTMKRDLISRTWFTETASTNIFHASATTSASVEAASPTAPPADPIPLAPTTDSAATTAPAPNTVLAESPAPDPAATETAPIETLVTSDSVEPVVTNAQASVPTDAITDANVADTSLDNSTPSQPSAPPTVDIDPVVSDSPSTSTNTPAPAVDEQLATSTIETPTILEAPTIVDTPGVAAESPAVAETPVVNVSVVAMKTLEPVAAAIISSPKPVTPTPDVPASPPSTAKIGDVIISELLPSPSAGNDEWVELENMTNASLLIDGLTLVDASGKVTSLSGTIGVGSYTLIPNPNGKLNNGADSVTLMNSSTTLDSVSYGDATHPAPKKDVSLARINGVWIAATPTPAAKNMSTTTAPQTTTTIIPTLSPTLYAGTTTVTTTKQATVTTNSYESTHSSSAPSTVARHVVAAVQSVATADPASIANSVNTASAISKTAKPKITVKKSSARSKSSVRSITIDDIATLTDGAKATIDGIVVAAPGTIGKRSFFLDGLEIYQRSGDLADVKIGDRVTVAGKVSVLTDHRRVNVREGAVEVIDQSTPIVHDYASTLPYGSLARITGTVSARDGNAVLLNTNSGTIKLAAGSGATIAWADLAGQTITATGILKHSDQETIILRSAADVAQQQNNEPISSATVAGTTASSSSLLWMTAALLALGSAGFGAWIWYTRPKARTSNLILHPTTV